MADLWGAFCALDLSWLNGFWKIILKLDSRAALALIHKDLDVKHPYALVFHKFQELLNRSWVVRVVKIFREANHVVHCLANLGHSLQLGACCYFVPPSCLCLFYMMIW